MIYIKALPRIDNILWLSKLARPFPTTAGDVLDKARKWSFSKSTLDFLKLFPRDEVFENGDDFFTRCEEIEMMLREERAMPVEFLRSPQE